MLARVLVAAVALWPLVYWVEAEKEARILCALSQPGTDAAEIDRLFGTGNLLRIRSETSGARRTLHVTSRRNLALSGCEVTLERGAVVRSSYYQRFRLATLAGALAVLGAGAVALVLTVAALEIPMGRPVSRYALPPLGAARRVACTILAALLGAGVLGASQLAGFASLASLDFVAPPIVGALTLAALALFVAAPATPHAPPQSGRASAFTLALACSGVVLLLGG